MFNFLKILFPFFFPTSIQEFQYFTFFLNLLVFLFFSFYHSLQVLSGSISCIPLIIKMWNVFLKCLLAIHMLSFLMSFSLLKTGLVV